MDNGQIFISQWLRLACAKLRIRHLNTRAYSPEAKGKIERFNRTVEEFLQKARLEKPPTLEQLNDLFRAGLSCEKAGGGSGKSQPVQIITSFRR